MSETIDKLRQKADDDDARVEAGKIHDMMQPEIVHHEQLARLQLHLLIAHTEPRWPVQRQEQLQAFVPRRSTRVPTRSVVEEFNEQGELLIQRHVVAPARIKLPGDVVRLEAEPMANLQ